MRRPFEKLSDDDFTGLPGEELIRQGLLDIAEGKESVYALLIRIAYPRLRGLGLEIPGIGSLKDSPEIHLYRLLLKERPRDSYVRYNVLIRRLVSFERCLEALYWRRLRNQGDNGTIPS